VSESDCGAVVEAILENTLSLALILPIKSINVASNNLVAETSNDGENISIICEIWWSHISWELSNDAQESSLKLSHLRSNTIVAEGGQVGMVPGVRGDLMVVSHTSDLWLVVVDAVIVLAIDEEGCLHAGSLDLIQNVGSIDIWTIIESNSECSWHRTACDDGSNWNSLLQGRG